MFNISLPSINIPTINDVAKGIDNVAGSNLSGRGGGAIADLGKEINRSDPGRWAGGFVDSTWQGVNRTLHAVSDIGRGDFQNAGKNLGRAAGSVGNMLTFNARQYILDNPNQMISMGKYTGGWTEDLLGTARGLRSQESDAYVSDADRNSAIRFGVKTGAVVAGAAYAPEIGAYAKEGGAWLWDKTVGYVSTKPIDAATVAYLATQGKGGQAQAAKLVTGGLLPDEIKDPVNNFIDRLINPPTTNPADPAEFGPWKHEAVPGTAYTPGSSSPVLMGEGAGTMLLIVGAVGIAAVILRKKGIL